MVANAGVCSVIDIVDGEPSIGYMTFLMSVEYHKCRSTSATMDDWECIFAINTRGVFLCYKYAGIQMIKLGRGGTHRRCGVCSWTQRSVRSRTRFRDLLDLTRRDIGISGGSAYPASKFAVHGLTQTAASGMSCHVNEQGICSTFVFSVGMGTP